MLVLRDTITEDLKIDDVLTSVRDTVLEAYEHQDYPFDRLVEKLGVERDPSRHPLFDVMVLYNEFEEESAFKDEEQNIHFRNLFDGNEMIKYDLSFIFVDNDRELQIELFYDKSLYAFESIELLRDQFIGLIASGLRNTDQPISDWDIHAGKLQSIRLEDDFGF
jgi:microcystin synthetase protein McyB